MLFTDLVSQLEGNHVNLIDSFPGENPNIVKGASIEKANENDLCFLEDKTFLATHLASTKCSALLIPQNEKYIEVIKKLGIPYAIVINPKLTFAYALKILCPEPKCKIEVHNSAVLGHNVSLGKNISIGPNVTIGDNCSIGDGSTIHAGAVLYRDVTIGINTTIHSNSVIHPKTIIQSDCVINSNAVIGSEGFGFIPTKEGWVKMPQTGIVVLEEKVEVGSGSTIDRPSVGETRIGADTKIDNLVQIGHGVTTGNGCAMAAQVGIAGGAKIGNSVILAGQVGVANKVEVGDGVVASSKCGIHTDIEPGNVISGFPAMPNKLWLRCSANFKRLPELVKSIRELDRKSSR